MFLGYLESKLNTPTDDLNDSTSRQQAVTGKRMSKDNTRTNTCSINTDVATVLHDIGAIGALPSCSTHHKKRYNPRKRPSTTKSEIFSCVDPQPIFGQHDNCEIEMNKSFDTLPTYSNHLPYRTHQDRNDLRLTHYVSWQHMLDHKFNHFGESGEHFKGKSRQSVFLNKSAVELRQIYQDSIVSDSIQFSRNRHDLEKATLGKINNSKIFIMVLYNFLS